MARGILTTALTTFLLATPVLGFEYRVPKKIDYDALFTQRRDVNVCVLNDANAPVPKRKIKKVISQAYTEYKEQVNIHFRTIAWNSWDDDHAASLSDRQEYIQTRCPEEADIQVVFTNAKKIDPSSDEGDPHYLRGSTYVPSGDVFVYDFSGKIQKDEGGHDANRTVLIHELGHQFRHSVSTSDGDRCNYVLFSDAHFSSEESFMYRVLKGTKGNWTQRDREIILENKFRTWE